MAIEQFIEYETSQLTRSPGNQVSLILGHGAISLRYLVHCNRVDIRGYAPFQVVRSSTSLRMSRVKSFKSFLVQLFNRRSASSWRVVSSASVTKLPLSVMTASCTRLSIDDARRVTYPRASSFATCL